MKKLLISLMTFFAFFAAFSQEDIPLDASIDFVQFGKAVKGVQVEGYACTTTAEDPTVYSALFTVNELNGAITAFNVSFYTLITSGNEEFVPVKEYELDGKKAYLGTNNFQSSGETPMNVLVVLFADLRMTITINAETGIPVETLETIIKKLTF
ncbi:hypothetical protein SDC9_128348 [bioreactor metagenome]|uniref:DUF4367 domain-containing protein n=1 Tax=bioreactor metagenome TaxID=1076179 RepID=A0A645CVY5_9ZZZZ